MPTNLDIDDLLSKVLEFQNQVSRVRSRLTNPQQRQLLGDLLGKIDETRVQVKPAYSKAIDTVEASAHRCQREAQEIHARVAALRQQIATVAAAKAQAQASAAAGKVPSAKPPQFDFQLGARLSSEMFERFAQRAMTVESEPMSDREIWQDWDWPASH